MGKQKQAHVEDIFSIRMKKTKAIFLFLFSCIFIDLFFVIMFKIQIFPPAKITTANESDIYREISIPVPRGTIYDRNGRILAMSVPFYSAYLDSWAIAYEEKKHPDYRKKLKNELRFLNEQTELYSSQQKF